MSYRTYVIANIHSQHPFFDKVDEYSFECKNVFNSALYEYRQNFFHGEDLWSAFDMINYLSKQEENKIPAKVKQQTIKQVYESMKSFDSKNKAAKLPRYLNKETGRANIILTNQAILKTRFTNENKIAFKYHDFCFEFNITNLINKLELKFEHIKQVRVIYNSTYKKYKVLLYVEKEKFNEDSLEKEPKLSQVAAIDLGLNNLMALVFQNQRILFDGKSLKKINHRFNKNLAKLQSQRDKAINELKAVSDEIKPMEQDAIWFYELEADIDFDVKKYQKLMRRQNDLIKEIDKLKTKIGKLYEKRNNRINYCLHERSKELIELLASNGIIKLVIGYNKNWKQDINLGKVNNQNFVQIPFYTLIEYIKYKAQEKNIEVITHEESYTSKCSFLDDEEICKHEKYAGKRVKRGLFRSSNGHEINADINAAYNIARKAGFNFKQFESLSPCSWAVVKRISFN